MKYTKDNPYTIGFRGQDAKMWVGDGIFYFVWIGESFSMRYCHPVQSPQHPKGDSTARAAMIYVGMWIRYLNSGECAEVGGFPYDHKLIQETIDKATKDWR